MWIPKLCTFKPLAFFWRSRPHTALNGFEQYEGAWLPGLPDQVGLRFQQLFRQRRPAYDSPDTIVNGLTGDKQPEKHWF